MAQNFSNTQVCMTSRRRTKDGDAHPSVTLKQLLIYKLRLKYLAVHYHPENLCLYELGGKFCSKGPCY